ncbi:hypothetical protein C2I06_12240 [Niallia circulans]|jgi:hypothetical protein|uniref:Uncharacterized protein n=1 Tax=Niallia circulans TaxID=1397 RepID=A0A268FBW3_NIACI|nr:hypothetical protein [Niallia circulans]AYV67571.1 hypothetical protein C2I06_12240 [Niallia circulans]AYV74072.1 hypothetical protein C2H98_22260 [Niallia circulans]NRG29649.1 hypothetical protein [Niallia circulans]PAD82862.1 hypothetical protein CHH57_12630 [Niallia circulans]UQZ76370.1 hypothetical protein C2I17_18410 [Niallia circulans]
MKVTREKFMNVVKVAEELGCKVAYDSTKKISFNTNMYITVPYQFSLENIYALAHEIGHVIDYVNGDLDHDKWLHDWSYRVNAEMSAWVHAYKILEKNAVPLHHWQTHVNAKLANYFILPEVI